jgi:hypothetical protein
MEVFAKNGAWLPVYLQIADDTGRPAGSVILTASMFCENHQRQ